MIGCINEAIEYFRQAPHDYSLKNEDVKLSNRIGKDAYDKLKDDYNILLNKYRRLKDQMREMQERDENRSGIGTDNMNISKVKTE